ncbi:hypothetical protein QBC45DRAFT_336004 [Copromyces sp. CBS 386.78]|nr:hypothetical protein QBC45DRAFT_336004 [Copromyces sp. CBS 386.78]
MIEDPFGPLWKEETNPEVYHKIRKRLWRAAGIFEENVQDMRKAVAELQEKLNIGSDGQPPSRKERVSFRKEMKRLSFSLNKSVYLELLTRIRDGVSSLERLTSQNSVLEPGRDKRSNGRLYRLMSSLSGGIYHALCTAMSACQCPTSHLLGLKLSSPPDTSVIPADEDDDVVRRLSMKLAVSDQEIPHGKVDRLWHSVMVKPSSRPRQCQVPLCQQPTTLVEPERPTKRARKTVGFSFSEKPTKRPNLLSRYSSREVEVKSSSRSSRDTQTLTLEVTSTKREEANEDMIMDLCETLRQLSTLQANACCGHITGPAAIDASATERYGLYALGHLRPSDSFGQCSFISLHDVLTQQLTTPSPFYDEDRVRLSYMLASGVLQLAGTPWLTTKVTTKDIFLIRCNGTTHFEEAFVIKQLPEISDSMQIDSQPPQDLAGPHQNQGLLFLGIILIEIMLGTPFATFRETHIKQHGSATLGSFFADYKTAITLLSRLETRCGPNYKRAVERCIRCKFPPPKPNMDGDEFRRLVYGHVVAPLEEDLKQYTLEELTVMTHDG